MKENLKKVFFKRLRNDLYAINYYHGLEVNEGIIENLNNELFGDINILEYFGLLTLLIFDGLYINAPLLFN